MRYAKETWVVSAWLLTGLFFAAVPAARGEGGEGKEAILFANDLGPAEVDVSSYPAKLRKTYRTTLKRCTKCHGLARPLNSHFLELDKEVISALKKKRPEVFEDENVLYIGETIWKRYVKRMMRKPGSGISKKEGKKIWEFLRYDSQFRKSGKSLDKWIEHRKKLLKDFKKKYPKKYAEHYGKTKK